MKLIDKDAVLAEIEKMIPQRAYERETLHSEFVRGQRVAYNKVLSFTDTLEVKEVDLEEDIKLWIEDNTGRGYCSAGIHEVAEHFFELGMKANNPITADERGTVDEIIRNLNQVEKDYRISLTKEIEWLRNKVGMEWK